VQALGRDFTRHIPGDTPFHSPARISAFIRDTFGPSALYGSMLIDSWFFSMAPDIPLERMPGVRAFYRGAGGTEEPSRYTEEWFDIWKKLQAVRNKISMERREDVELAGELEEDFDRMMFSRFEGDKRRYTAIAKTRRRISVAPNLKELQSVARAALEGAHPAELRRISKSKDWGDQGALRFELLNFFYGQWQDVFRAGMARERNLEDEQ
jgi:hypothetical protein